MTARRVLVVDDESYLRSFIKDVLEPAFTVSEAGDGLDALKVLEDSLDVIIVDYTMPKMTGVELVKRIRALPRHHDTPVLIITALDEERTFRECRAAGANRILQKPFHPRALVDTVGELARDHG